MSFDKQQLGANLNFVFRIDCLTTIDMQFCASLNDSTWVNSVIKMDSSWFYLQFCVMHHQPYWNVFFFFQLRSVSTTNVFYYWSLLSISLEKTSLWQKEKQTTKSNWFINKNKNYSSTHAASLKSFFRFLSCSTWTQLANQERSGFDFLYFFLKRKCTTIHSSPLLYPKSSATAMKNVLQ